MNKRVILLAVAMLVCAAVTWWGGQALWRLLLAMHGRR